MNWILDLRWLYNFSSYYCLVLSPIKNFRSVFLSELIICNYKKKDNSEIIINNYRLCGGYNLSSHMKIRRIYEKERRGHLCAERETF